MNTNKKTLRKKGFTIVELLTVMGVIAILIGLLVPALTLVRDYAKEIQQKSQFHGIDVGLEMYKTEFGNYPPSNDNSDPYNSDNDDPDDSTPYSGANKLAEAMVGLDMLGVHPRTNFRSDGINIRDDGSGTGTTEDFAVYHPDKGDPGNSAGMFIETAVENVQARKGPFIELENANVFEMQDVYEDVTTVGFRTSSTGPSEIEQSLVLCDEYFAKRQSGKKTGMPILYYKARRLYTQQNSEDEFKVEDDIYYYPDNENILALGIPDDSTIDHPLYLNGGSGTDDWLTFQNMILNTQITQINRPYRADSYILISAGSDGMYGTPDDMFNFDKND